MPAARAGLEDAVSLFPGRLVWLPSSRHSPSLRCILRGLLLLLRRLLRLLPPLFPWKGSLLLSPRLLLPVKLLLHLSSLLPLLLRQLPARQRSACLFVDSDEPRAQGSEESK